LPIDPELKPERLPGLWQRVGEYWWLGLDAGDPAQRWTGKHDGDRPRRSRRAGRRRIRLVRRLRLLRHAHRRRRTAHFPYAASHSVYIDAARAGLARPAPRSGAVARNRPARYAPHPGRSHLLRPRIGRGTSAYEDLPAGRFASHCAIVVNHGYPAQLSVIGGNVDDAVALTHVPLTDGMLPNRHGRADDPRYPWSVVLRVLYDY
jgi:hypothetical protein